MLGASACNDVSSRLLGKPIGVSPLKPDHILFSRPKRTWKEKCVNNKIAF